MPTAKKTGERLYGDALVPQEVFSKIAKIPSAPMKIVYPSASKLRRAEPMVQPSETTA